MDALPVSPTCEVDLIISKICKDIDNLLPSVNKMGEPCACSTDEQSVWVEIEMNDCGMKFYEYTMNKHAGRHQNPGANFFVHVDHWNGTDFESVQDALYATKKGSSYLYLFRIQAEQEKIVARYKFTWGDHRFCSALLYDKDLY